MTQEELDKIVDDTHISYPHMRRWVIKGIYLISGLIAIGIIDLRILYENIKRNR